MSLVGALPSAVAVAATGGSAGGYRPGPVDRTPVGGSPSGHFGAANRVSAGTVVSRTANTNTGATGKGNFKTILYPGPVNYRNAAGHYAPIVNTLVPAPASSGEAVENQANGFMAQLPARLSAAPVRFAVGNRSVSFQLAGSGLSSVTGHVAGNADTFTNALPHTTVRYTTENAGLQESLILGSASAPSVFTYRLKVAAGLTPVATGLGGIDFRTAGGRVAFAMPAPSMQDASGLPSGFSRAVHLALTGSGGAYTLTLTPSAAWLAAPGRQYPVTVDPTIDFVGANTDCYIVGGSYATQNFCGGTNLDLGYDGTEAGRSLLYYDLAGAIPANAQVLSANLGLYLYGATTSNSTPVTVHALTQAWTSGATWNTYNGTNAWTAAGGTFTSTDYYKAQNVGASTATWVHWWPTALVQGWLDGGIANDGLILKEAAPENVTNILQFYSTEYSNSAYWPTLQVTWEPQVGVQGFYKLQNIPLDHSTGLYVNVANGNLGVKQHDLQIAGTGLPLHVTRYFNNLSDNTIDLGTGWVMNTGRDVGLLIFSSGSAAFYGPSGYQIPFTLHSNGTFSAPPGINATLVKNGDGTYTLTLLQTGLRYDFTAGGYLSSEQTQNGNTVSFAYNPNGTLASITDTQGRVTTFSYNPSGFITTMTGPSGLQYQYIYNPQNNLTSYTDPAGNKTTYGYDSSDDLTSITDPLGNQTTLTYNSSYQVTSITLPTGAKWTFAYHPDSSDAAGSTVVTDPNGHSTTYSYDVQGRVTKVVDPAGNATALAYTADGNVQQLTDASNNSTNYSFANVASLPGGASLTGFTLPTGAGGSFTYGDGACPFHPTAYTDPQGNTLDYGYDSHCNLTSVTDGLASDNHYTFAYNSNGTLASMTDAMGNVTTYGYDSAGNLTSITPPSPLGQTTITYDALSRVTSVTDGNGHKTTYSYNGLNELTGITYADGTGVTYTYNADGDVTAMADPTGTTSYGYDALNRVLQKTLPSGATISYTYDAAGNLTSFADGGGTVDYAYNSLNLLTSLTDPQGNQTTYAYNAEYQPTSIADPNGVTMTLTYNSAGQLHSIAAQNASGTELTGYSYSYVNPATGDHTALRYSVEDAAGNTTAYSYDVLNRLTLAKTTSSGGTVTADHQYAYDGNGNRTSKTVNGTTTAYSYNAANELTAAGATTYSYDANGNETGSSAGLALTYNAANMTSSITPPNASAIAMTYTGATQVERVAAGGTTYQYGALGLGNQTTAGATTYFTRTPSGQLVSMRTGSGTYYYLFDGLGSVVGLTDASGNLVARYHYAPYSTITAKSGTEASANPWRFAGTYYDSATGLYKMGARYYDPGLGRFTQRDPQLLAEVDMLPMTLNAYAYVQDSPTNNLDPTGTFNAGLCAFAIGLYAWGFAVLTVGFTTSNESLINDAMAIFEQASQDFEAGCLM